MIPKLIALDLDDTTLDQESHLPPENRKALEAAAKGGIHLVVATGRPLGTLPQEIRMLPGVRYAITGNGAAIYDLETGAVLLRRVLSAPAVEKILACSQGAPLTYETFIQGKAYAQRDYISRPEEFMADPQTVRYVQETRTPVENIVEFILEHKTELDSIDLVVKSLDVKKCMMQKLASIEDVYITTSVPRLIELGHRDCGKHRGLQFLTDYLGIPQADTVAFGNGDNDAEMLEWAGLGVSVENGTPACRAAADCITGNAWESGVAEVLWELLK